MIVFVFHVPKAALSATLRNVVNPEGIIKAHVHSSNMNLNVHLGIR